MDLLYNSPNIKWVFIYGSGGSGKTVTSCSIGINLSKYRKVLIISFDKYHDISDTFGQCFTTTPAKVTNYDNLYCMEYITRVNEDDLITNIPCTERALDYIEVMHHTLSLPYDTIIFDGMPNEHINHIFHYNVENTTYIHKLHSIWDYLVATLKYKSDIETTNIEKYINRISDIKSNLLDKTRTLFLSVCRPEFNSVFEMERATQSLMDNNMELSIIIINGLVTCLDNQCQLCTSIQRNQTKYINMIHNLYRDLDIKLLYVPFMLNEVRKFGLEQFSEKIR